MIAGKQTKVTEGQKVLCNKLPSEKDATIEFSEVAMVRSGDKLVLGTPFVKGAKVTARFDKNIQGKKVMVFKYLRKNRQKKSYGHRQPYSIIKIEKIEA